VWLSHYVWDAVVYHLRGWLSAGNICLGRFGCRFNYRDTQGILNAEHRSQSSMLI
jgi:hypothetical protein